MRGNKRTLKNSIKPTLLQAIVWCGSIVLGVVLPLLRQSPVAAGSLVAARSVKMANSTPGASSVTYHVSFTAQSNVATAGYVVQFCDNSPIIASTTCTHTAATTTKAGVYTGSYAVICTGTF